MLKSHVPVEFEWDRWNLEKNWIKHKVHFKEAEEIFLNKPIKIFPDPRHSKVEVRAVAYGITNKKRKLAIIFTIREEKIRIISARDQSKNERNRYEKKD